MSNLFKVFIHRCRLFINNTYVKLLIIFSPLRHYFALKKIRQKKIIKVVFFATHSSNWKYDFLYRLMYLHERFDPLILVCPVDDYGHDNMIREMDKCYSLFSSKKYNVVKAYDIDNNTYIDVNKEISPDIIFFTNPYQEVNDYRYYIFNFLNTLTCYAPYGYAISNNENMLFNLPFHNLLWKGFYETDLHKKMAIDYSFNKGRNIEPVGYLLYDEFSSFKSQRTSSKKIIIWAPHHTLETNSEKLGYSCFFKYYEDFLMLREKYKDKIYWVFKPHPLLRVKLYKHPQWGVERTTRYYDGWANSDYSEINEGNYTQAFIDSDALILDSISFVAEYYYTLKPSLFTIKDATINNKFNLFGQLAFNQLYKGREISDIVYFIDNVVIGGNDYLLSKRKMFYNNILHKGNASSNIIKILERELFH